MLPAQQREAVGRFEILLFWLQEHTKKYNQMIISSINEVKNIYMRYLWSKMLRKRQITSYMREIIRYEVQYCHWRMYVCVCNSTSSSSFIHKISISCIYVYFVVKVVWWECWWACLNDCPVMLWPLSSKSWVLVWTHTAPETQDVV